MIRVSCLEGGKIKSFSLSQISTLRPTVLADCINPSKEELSEIADALGLQAPFLHRLLDINERPQAYEHENYSIITFHALFSHKERDRTAPFSILIRKNLVFVLRNHPVAALDSLEMADSDRKTEILEGDATHALYLILSDVTNEFFRITNTVETKIDTVEDDIFKNLDKKTVKDIFSLKKTLIYLHKSLLGNREVIGDINSQFLKEVKGKSLGRFIFLYKDIVQLIEMVATYRDIVSTDIENHLTAVQNNLAEVMKQLTVITAFILMPTLIASMYGMNFQFMPEIHILKDWGYAYAICMMVVSTLIVYFYFRKKKWL